MKYRVIERFRGKYSTEAMCEVFEVSRSGYYAWRKRQGKEEKDQWLVDLIVECQRLCKICTKRRCMRCIEGTAEPPPLGEVIKDMLVKIVGDKHCYFY